MLIVRNLTDFNNLLKNFENISMIMKILKKIKIKKKIRN